MAQQTFILADLVNRINVLLKLHKTENMKKNVSARQW